MNLTFRGVRGSIPTPERSHLGFGGNTSCLEVRGPGSELLVIDGGSGARALGAALTQEFGRRVPDLHFLMTHFHWDHIQGLPFFTPLYTSENRVTFHSPKPPEVTRQILDRQMENPYFPVGSETFSAHRDFVLNESGPLRLGGITVQPFPLHHPQGASGYRIECGGAVIVHASDFEHGEPRLDSVLRDHAQNADVLVFDAQYSPEQYVNRRGWGHSTWLEATRVARDAGVKQLVLFHHDPAHDDVIVQQLVDAARIEFEQVEAAREGWTIRL